MSHAIYCFSCGRLGAMKTEKAISCSYCGYVQAIDHFREHGQNIEREIEARK
jgi:hypothetical protein